MEQVDDFGRLMAARIAARVGVCSPASAKAMLAAMAICAGGKTREAILDFLGHSSVKSLCLEASRMRNSGGDSLKLSASVWFDKSMQLQSGFREEAAGFDWLQIFQSDFSKGSATREAVNTWASLETGGMITEAVPLGFPPPASVHCGVGAAWMGAKWLNPFDKGQTTTGIFRGSSGDSQEMFMERRMEIRAAAHGKWAAAILPMEGNLSMALAIPSLGEPVDVRGGFNAIDSIQAWSVPAQVRIPRLKAESSFGLRQDLMGMGLRAPFSPGADFTPSIGSYGEVDAVLHRTLFSWDEDGASGASVSSYSVSRSRFAMGSELEPVRIEADCPFFWAAMSGKDILFCGVRS
jgi:serine protease inhibitor